MFDFGSVIKNVFGSPKKTAGGAWALLGTAALGYQMYRGTVPVNETTIGALVTGTSTGLALLGGKDNSVAVAEVK